MTLEQVEQKLTEEARKHKSRLGKVEKDYYNAQTQERYIDCVRLSAFIQGIEHAVGVVSLLREQPLPFAEKDLNPVLTYLDGI